MVNSIKLSILGDVHHFEEIKIGSQILKQDNHQFLLKDKFSSILIWTQKC